MSNGCNDKGNEADPTSQNLTRSHIRRVRTRSASFKNLLQFLTKKRPPVPDKNGRCREDEPNPSLCCSPISEGSSPNDNSSGVVLGEQPSTTAGSAARVQIDEMLSDHNDGCRWRKEVRKAQIQRRSTAPNLGKSKDSDYRRALEVLVVDDSMVARLILQRNLGKAGHITLPVSSSEEALQLLKERWENADCSTRDFPDAILIDLFLPNGMSGLELVSTIRSCYPGLETPLIAHTTSEDWEEGGFCLSSWLLDTGFTDYTFKGARSDGLLGLLDVQVNFAEKCTRKMAPL